MVSIRLVCSSFRLLLPTNPSPPTKEASWRMKSSRSATVCSSPLLAPFSFGFVLFLILLASLPLAVGPGKPQKINDGEKK